MLLDRAVKNIVYAFIPPVSLGFRDNREMRWQRERTGAWWHQRRTTPKLNVFSVKVFLIKSNTFRRTPSGSRQEHHQAHAEQRHRDIKNTQQEHTARTSYQGHRWRPWNEYWLPRPEPRLVPNHCIIHVGTNYYFLQVAVVVSAAGVL